MEKLLMIGYGRCSTCQKARKWLDEKGIAYDFREIKENNPKAEELELWIDRSGLPIKKFFNTSGLVYKSLNLKDKLGSMTEADMISLLAGDGMLVKRPILVGKNFVLLGFKEQEWEKIL